MRAFLSVILLAVSAAPLAAQVDVEAIPGIPFGVGRITVPLEASYLGDPSGLSISEKNGRLLYPAVTPGAVRRLLGNLLGRNGRNRRNVTALFLFRGNEPLEITIETPTPRRLVVRPRPDVPRTFDRLFKRWWREYHAVVRKLVKQGDHPPTVYTYLTSMLSRRLGMPAPLLSRPKRDERSEVQRTFELLAGVEALRNANLRATSLGQLETAGRITMPVPRDVIWHSPRVGPVDPKVALESIASHVPEECFYVRFGNFRNYLWMEKLLNEYGGDIGRMVQMRGSDTRAGERFKKQLALKQSALAEIMGPRVVADVAIIGRDAYVEDGAAMGVVFQAKNSTLFLIDIRKQRATALAEEKENGAKLEDLKIAGTTVSFLSTPDNRLRSFLVSQGDYHLVTTSKEIARRFIEASQGKRALADAAEFRQARTILPLSNEHTVFVYFSSAFFRGLTSPQYQVELQRRLQSMTEIDMIRLARLAAANERVPGRTINELIQSGLLPANFGIRADGSSAVWRDGRLADSLRGGRGTYLPVADVPISGVTASEAASYRRRAEYYQENWRQMDPVMIGVKRFALNEEGLERVTVDAFITPMDNKKYKWLISSLGAPLQRQITKTPGDIIWWQASLRGGLISPTIPAHILFGAVKDQYPVSDLKPDGLFKTYQVLKTTPGYLGGWPQPGFLDRLPLGLAPRPDAAGYARMAFGLWRRQYGEFAVLAFDPRLLAEVTPQLRVVAADDQAQVRVEVGDLSKAKLAVWINSLNYERARQTSHGNVRLLQTLNQQLGVPKARAKRDAEELLDAELLCSLGGKYELALTRGGGTLWRSTKAPFSDSPAPRDYRAPLLGWFRGLTSSLTKYDDKLVVHAELDMQRKPGAAPVKLPVFNLFQTGSKKKKENAKTKPATKKKKGPRRFE